MSMSSMLLLLFGCLEIGENTDGNQFKIFFFLGFMDFLGCSAVFLMWVWFVSDGYEFNAVYAVWLLRNCWEKKMGISSVFNFYVFMDFL